MGIERDQLAILCSSHSFRTEARKRQSLNGNYLSDINGSGVISGYYYVGLNIHSFIYSNGVFKDVLPSNGTDTAISGINGYGVVVGTTTLSSGVSTLFTAHCQ